MQYRKLGKSGLDVSVLGFGCMRFPVIEEGNEHLSIFEKPVKVEEAEKMLLHAVDNGINYFDTAYPYHGGKSEEILGKTIKPFRDKVLIATKLPMMMVQSASDIERFIDEQLKRLETDYVDFYLLHGLNGQSWSLAKKYNALDFLERLLSDGRIRYAGFSFHDEVKMFKEIVDGFDWTLCQIQYNYFDENRQAGKEGLQYAAKKGMGIVIMEPLRGGKLAENMPPVVQEIWDSTKIKRTPAEWALRWVFNHPEVSVVLSGMSAMPQLVENLKIAKDARADSLTANELVLISKVREKFEEMLKVKCTGCGYCMPCPNGINIPMNFNSYNNSFLFDDQQRSKMAYNMFMPEEQRAGSCEECGECEEKCPQNIEIMDELKNVHELLKMDEPSSMPKP
ncbi:aldo/keto reductase [Thermodesulfobacteriota bacterium]